MNQGNGSNPFEGMEPGKMQMISGRPETSAAVLAEIRSKFGVPQYANGIRPNPRRAGRVDHVAMESPTQPILFFLSLDITDPAMPAALAAYADECRKLGKIDQAHRFLELCELVHRYQRVSGISAGAALDRKRAADPDWLETEKRERQTKSEAMREHHDRADAKKLAHRLAELKATKAAQDAERADRGESSLSAFLADRFVSILKESSSKWTSCSYHEGDHVNLDMQLRGISSARAREKFTEAIEQWKAEGKIIDLS